MPVKVLVAYATFYGSTKEVAEVVTGVLRDAGFDTDLLAAKDVRGLAGYAAVVLGAPLAMHKLHKDALGFLSRHRKALDGIPLALFVLGPVHVPHDDSEWEDSRVQLAEQLARLGWLKPITAEVLGGKFDPALLRWPLNKMAGSEPASDIRDWDAIRAWATDVARLLGGSSDAPETSREE